MPSSFFSHVKCKSAFPNKIRLPDTIFFFFFTFSWASFTEILNWKIFFLTLLGILFLTDFGLSKEFLPGDTVS